MKKIDEMDRNIQLRAEEIGYRLTLIILSVWTLYNCWQTLVNGAKYNPFPGLIMCLVVSVQSLSQTIMKQKMIAGDEEYHEPNRILWMIAAGIATAAIALSVGTYFIGKP